MRRILWSLFCCLLVTVFSVSAAEITITADELSYNGQSETALAVGNVVVQRGNARLTGARGEYYFTDGSASLSGGVTYTAPGTSLTATSVRLYADETLQADGNVQIHDGENTLLGDHVTYNSNSGYGTVTGNAVLEMPNTRMTASYIEAFMNEIRLIGSGGVNLYNDEHGMTAVADNAIYTQSPGADDGYLMLRGNARVDQRGNILTGPRLDIRVEDRSVETKGRSTLIIKTGD